MCLVWCTLYSSMLVCRDMVARAASRGNASCYLVWLCTPRARCFSRPQPSRKVWVLRNHVAAPNTPSVRAMLVADTHMGGGAQWWWHRVQWCALLLCSARI